MMKKKNIGYGKGFLWGFAFGVVVVFLAVLGLISLFFEVVFKPFTFVPSGIVNVFIDTANASGGINMLSIVIVSGFFYGLIGVLITWVFRSLRRS